MTSDAGTGTGGRGFLAAHPHGLQTLFFTELWERFSYYGMRALLTLFMVAPVANGGLAFAVEDAGRIYGNYTMAVYMLAIPGGFIADRITGARNAVLAGGWTIALGHYALAIPSAAAFYPGLLLIALGTGLFKPNISALLGSLYATGDQRRDAGFSIFYMGINLGAFIAPLVTGFLAQSAGFKILLASNGFDPAKSWHWGFAAAGAGMTLAMLIFGRNVGIKGAAMENPAPTAQRSSVLRHGLYAVAGTLALMALALISDIEGYAFLRWMFVLLPAAGIALGVWYGTPQAQRLAAVGVLFIASMIFWAIFEQAGTTIALFAEKLTRSEIFGVAFPSAWFQSVNPVFVILLAPVFAALWLRLGARQPSPAIKFAFGLLFLAASFVLMVPAAKFAASGAVSPLWLVGLFFLQTTGELLLSPVGLSTMTKLAPQRMTGLVLGVWFLAAAFGNKLAGVLGGNFTSEAPQALAQAFLTQAALVAIAAGLLFMAAPWVNRLSQHID